MMDVSNSIGFCLIQVEPSTPKKFYMQELEDLTKYRIFMTGTAVIAWKDGQCKFEIVFVTAGSCLLGNPKKT
jgi:hypothetical protein